MNLSCQCRIILRAHTRAVAAGQELLARCGQSPRCIRIRSGRTNRSSKAGPRAVIRIGYQAEYDGIELLFDGA
jgi:hypothetical protein